jgi:hypothetical protein
MESWKKLLGLGLIVLGMWSCTPDRIDQGFIRMESILNGLEQAGSINDPMQTGALIGEFESIALRFQELAPPLSQEQQDRLANYTFRLITLVADLNKKIQP